MNRRSLLTSILTVTLVLPSLPASAQTRTAPTTAQGGPSRGAGPEALQIVERHREPSRAGRQPLAAEPRPEWVEQAFGRSLQHLQKNASDTKVQNAAEELRLVEVARDRRGHTDVRLWQTHLGLPVYGAEVITHLDAAGALKSVSGRVYDEARIDVTPEITAKEAIAIARAASTMGGPSEPPLPPGAEVLAEGDPEAALAVAPNRVLEGNPRAQGAELVYVVKLPLAEDEDLRIFVSALDGRVLARSSDRHSVDGFGQSLYSGNVMLSVTYNGYTNYRDHTYTLMDPNRASSLVYDVRYDKKGVRLPDRMFTRNDQYFGTVARETAAVDVHFGVAQSWDYFQQRFGRRGADGLGGKITSYVHYNGVTNGDGSQGFPNQATGGRNKLTFGDGDGITFNPLVTLDIVAHEFTHCVIDGVMPNSDLTKDAGMVYQGESGAIDESLSDIFGTAVEQRSGINPDWLIGEDMGSTFRSMSNPATYGDPDNYSNYWSTTLDNGGVHTNSGIPNHAFYLMAAGGRNPTSGVYVPPIDEPGVNSREAAETVFYNALVRYLTPSSTFRDLAIATRSVAAEIYGPNAAGVVETAWFAVGVFAEADRQYGAVPFPSLTRGRMVLYEPGTGNGEIAALNVQNGAYIGGRVYGGGFHRNWTHIVSMGGPIFFYDASTGQAAVGQIGFYIDSIQTTHSFTIPKTVTFTSVAYLGGWDIYFYDSVTGQERAITITSSGYQNRPVSIAPGANYSHVAYVQGQMLFYRQATGAGLVVTGTQKRLVSFAPGFTNIVDAGRRNDGDLIGTLFYDRSSGRYQVVDVSPTGEAVVRVSTRWTASPLAAGWGEIVVMGEGLFFYDTVYGDAMTARLLTRSECERLGRQPFEGIWSGYVPSMRVYKKVGAGAWY